jgi:protocatechuate 3,4-dioxygenase beta subunit
MKPILPKLISTISILLLAAVSQSIAQTPQRDNRPRTASISGRVTVGGSPAPDAPLRIMEINRGTDGERQVLAGGALTKDPTIFVVRTDSDGRYRVVGLAAGTYRISVTSKVHVLANLDYDLDPAKQITLDDGETRENIDLALARGGVIMGRVTNAEGKPLIEAVVKLYQVAQRDGQMEYKEFGNQSHQMSRTDDRGVYRIYRLPAGRYIVSAGGDVGQEGRSVRDYRRTYFGDTTSQEKARIIEVKEGGETVDINIRLGGVRRTYEAAGRLTEADTGKPIPRVHVWCHGYGKEGGEQNPAPESRTADTVTDSQGNFRLDGLIPGKYKVSYSSPHEDKEYYSDEIEFEVIDENVEGLEIIAKRGASISGVAVIEGAADPKLQSLLFVKNSFRAEILQTVEHGQMRSGLPIRRIEPNGQFRFSGLPSGRVWFQAEEWQVKSLRVLRVEHNGVEVKDGIEIARGEQITGVRVVFTQASGVIRGQVKFADALPENAEIQVTATPASDETSSSAGGYSPGVMSTTADEKGRFLIERLLPGEYQVSAYVTFRIGRASTMSDGKIGSPLQRVTVTNAAESTVELTLEKRR